MVKCVCCTCVTIFRVRIRMHDRLLVLLSSNTRLTLFIPKSHEWYVTFLHNFTIQWVACFRSLCGYVMVVHGLFREVRRKIKTVRCMFPSVVWDLWPIGENMLLNGISSVIISFVFSTFGFSRTIRGVLETSVNQIAGFLHKILVVQYWKRFSNLPTGFAKSNCVQEIFPANHNGIRTCTGKCACISKSFWQISLLDIIATSFYWFQVSVLSD